MFVDIYIILIYKRILTKLYIELIYTDVKTI